MPSLAKKFMFVHNPHRKTRKTTLKQLFRLWLTSKITFVYPCSYNEFKVLKLIITSKWLQYFDANNENNIAHIYLLYTTNH